MVKNIRAAYLDHAVGVGLHSGFGDDWLRIGGIKIFADGALGPRTALMVEPYEGEPNNYGIAVVDKEEMMQIAGKASRNNLSVTVHAIGDKANHDILDVYAAVRVEESGRLRGNASSVVLLKPNEFKLRHRIEHVQLLHPADLKRLAQLGVIASMQPLHATSDMVVADRNWGSRAQYSYAWRTLLNAGTSLVFGSDTPIEPIEPLKGIYAAVNRRLPNGKYAPDGWYPEQKLTLAETIHAFTQAAAYTAGVEKRTGSVTAGKLADLTIYDRNIFAIADRELSDVEIAGTIVGGQFKYRDF
jgi:predicted amidohydrolase YtcJ